MLCCTDIHLPPPLWHQNTTTGAPLHNKVTQASPQHPVYPSTIRHLKSTQRAQLPWRLTLTSTGAVLGCSCLAWISANPSPYPDFPPVLPWARFGTFHDRHLQLLLPSSIRTATPHLIAIPSRRRYLTLPLSLALSCLTVYYNLAHFNLVSSSPGPSLANATRASCYRQASARLLQLGHQLPVATTHTTGSSIWSNTRPLFSLLDSRSRWATPASTHRPIPSLVPAPHRLKVPYRPYHAPVPPLLLWTPCVWRG
ncbi:hypothetical protein BDP81DRAFT_2063 [Colletotrichum phormii]|uniref:Uncharacterized protein n=1 Tax=Colletotrichum phormii TaxID=359342 RepID=A0AAJ0A658_9PEZI|nr:uncharacterized protein BDP81DRAFT_2063 [Colletotrichum phormii]KAK1655300.1 hypothetical protein BDP81DRAFT_2063 [Colletotrichum phormii]